MLVRVYVVHVSVYIYIERVLSTCTWWVDLFLGVLVSSCPFLFFGCFFVLFLPRLLVYWSIFRFP